MASTPSMGLPNPLTPMAFLPPDIARHLTISQHMVVSSLVILLWETLNSVSVDLRLIRIGFSLPMAAYFLSRITLLTFLIGFTLLNTAPLGNCEEVGRVVLWFYPLQMSFTALLFFFRVRAMYRDSKWVAPFFFVMWLGVSGASTTEALISNTNLGPTKYCIGKGLPKYTIVAGFLPFINDTLVFLAITVKLAGIPDWKNASDKKAWIRKVLLGQYLPTFSKAMLWEGQAYYLSTIGLYLIFLILFYVKAVPEAIKWAVGLPGVTIVNIMACRVYRNTKLGIYSDESKTVLGIPTSIDKTTDSERSRASQATRMVVFSRMQQKQEKSGNADIESIPESGWERQQLEVGGGGAHETKSRL